MLRRNGNLLSFSVFKKCSRSRRLVPLDVSALHSYTDSSISLHTMEAPFPVVHNERPVAGVPYKAATLPKLGYLIRCPGRMQGLSRPTQAPCTRVLADWQRYGVYDRKIRRCAVAASLHLGLRGNQKQKQAYSVGQDYTPPSQHMSLVLGPAGPHQ
jgi:hypothetical protein